MRFYEISSGIRVTVNEEEQELLTRAVDEKKLERDKLSEREQEVARLMTSRGLFNRERDEGKIYYTPSSSADLWRY